MATNFEEMVRLPRRVPSYETVVKAVCRTVLDIELVLGNPDEGNREQRS